jgi:predicted ATP-grasp superfamily ATP-dependent carboligase
MEVHVRPLSEVLGELEKLLPNPLTQSNQRQLVILRELATHLVRLDNRLKSIAEQPTARQELSNLIRQPEEGGMGGPRGY